MNTLLRWLTDRRGFRQKGTQTARPPMPIIVGSPRSGTTLLRFMLDAHPELAIPPETGFLSVAGQWDDSGDNPSERIFQEITTFPAEAPGWQDFHVPAEAYRRELHALKPCTAADAVRLFYRMYAARFGKSRWGDKTPIYCRSIPVIEGLLPESRFIHIIRDGRDAALSLRTRFFSPGYDMETQAAHWQENVVSAMQAGKRCRHYLEIRYEDLLRDAEAVLRKVCAFIELDYHPDMLRYHERTPGRLQEHLTRYRADGSVLIPQQERLLQQAATMRPPDASRIGVWRNGLREDEIRRFEGVAGALLEELRYPLFCEPDRSN